MHKDYKKLLEAGYSLDYLKSFAGYFEDNLNSTEFLFENISKDLIALDFKKNKSRVIVSLSGCFNSLHSGHLECLKLVRDNYVDHEVQAILYPAHDSYVKTKNNGPSIKNRLVQMREFLKNESEWIKIDSYPATSLKGEVNFPYLIDRTEEYGKIYNAKTAFVVGEDNIGFGLVMEDRKTQFFAVRRENSTSSINTRNFIYLENNKYADLSSTKIRNS
jgi:nicotinic acid mononucleotide adenylyltransferase